MSRWWEVCCYRLVNNTCISFFSAEVKIGGMSTEYVNQMIQKVKGTGMPNM